MTPQPLPTCDYCTDPAPFYERDSGTESPICERDARDHYPSGWRACVGKIGPRWHARQAELNA